MNNIETSEKIRDSQSKPWRYRRPVVAAHEAETRIRQTMGGLGWRCRDNTEVCGKPTIFSKVYQGVEYQVKSSLGGRWRLRQYLGLKVIHTKYQFIQVRDYAWVYWAPAMHSCVAMALWFDRVGTVLIRMRQETPAYNG